MHELAIADSIVRMASEHAGGRRVAKVTMRVGHLRQVVPSALAFGFELVAAGTPVEGAELEIEHVPTTVCCDACGEESVQNEFPLRCAMCRGLNVEVVAGEELLVESLELVG